MSRTSVKFALEEERFNLKTIALVLFLVDFFLLPYVFIYPHLWEMFWLLIVYEISMVTSFLLGLRGQGKYKEAMLHLQSIARNKKITLEQREAKLVQGIHHYCLELGYIYDTRNKMYGLHFFKRNGNEQIHIKHKRLEHKKKRIVITK